MEGRLQTGVVERVSNDPGLSSDNPARSGTVIKVNANRLRDLLLRMAEILALRGDAACPFRIIPPCRQKARLLVTPDLKCDLVHGLGALFHTGAGPSRSLP